MSTYLGLLLSWHFDLAAGASVVLTAVVIFFIVAIVQALVPSRRPVSAGPWTVHQRR